jgi:predicted transcriptional regulator
MTTTAVRTIVETLQSLGIGMAEARIFVHVNKTTITQSAARAGTTKEFAQNKLKVLRRKGLIQIDSTTKPATYSHTSAGRKAMATIQNAQ